MKLKRKSVVKGVAPLLIVSLIIMSLLVVPASAADDASSSAPADQLVSFWSDLIDWFTGAVSECVGAYYSADTGLTFLGVFAVAVLAFACLCVLFVWIRNLFRIGR